MVKTIKSQVLGRLITGIVQCNEAEISENRWVVFLHFIPAWSHGAQVDLEIVAQIKDTAICSPCAATCDPRAL